MRAAKELPFLSEAELEEKTREFGVQSGDEEERAGSDGKVSGYGGDGEKEVDVEEKAV